MGSSPANFGIIGKVERPEFSTVFTVKDVEMVNLPHEKFFQDKNFDEFKKTAPHLVPFVKGEVEFAFI